MASAMPEADPQNEGVSTPEGRRGAPGRDFETGDSSTPTPQSACISFTSHLGSLHNKGRPRLRAALLRLRSIVSMKQTAFSGTYPGG